MRDLQPLIKKYHNRITQKYYNKSPLEVDKEDHKKYLWSLYLSEMYAFIKDVIPEEYISYSIFDYTGQIQRKDQDGKISTEQVVPIDVALQVKNKICNFCYNSSWEDLKKRDEKSKEESLLFIRQNNCMNVRLNRAENIIIHGERGYKAGRTMLASIIMKEAIRGRVLHPSMRYNSYSWVNFWSLIDDLKKDTDEAIEYRTCDWLVIDDIINRQKSSVQKTLFSGLLDPFFYDRYRFKLPTILIFKFDISDDADIEGNFGSGITKIIDSSRTTIIQV